MIVCMIGYWHENMETPMSHILSSERTSRLPARVVCVCLPVRLTLCDAVHCD